MQSFPSILCLALAAFASFLVFSNEVNGYQHERIITDVRSIRRGVPIDNRYIQPNYGYDFQHVSAPGCPKSSGGSPWLYYGNRCYLTETRGPCKFYEIFKWQRSSSSGVCRVDFT
ncbi:unnamed protein product [Orchesella dallaii]|uniref:Uncharacterized protein n=1 Tax=Orchesella dallaii TaxID=48710 RepID=A0ABP1S2S9_9HEXA